MYVQRNYEVRSRNYCCSVKIISIQYSKCVFVALDILHAPYCHCGLSGYTFFPQYLKRHDFPGKKIYIGHKICVLTFPTTFVWNISHSKKNCERYY
jgi:hypothetical protein